MRNRSYDLKAFHVVDVNYLEFLPIGTEDEFSKENGPSVLFPWKIHIENVSRITSREKLFGETLEGCQNMGEPFSILSLANVSLDRLPSHLLKVRQPIHHVIFDKIVTSFENIDAIYFKTNHVTVTRSNFSVLPPKGIFFEGRGVSKTNYFFQLFFFLFCFIKASKFHLVFFYSGNEVSQ